MDERLERDLRSGLAALLDPIEGSHPRWATSPAARRAQGAAARRWPIFGLDRRWAVALAALLVVCLIAAAAFFGWRHQQAVTTHPTPTPSATAEATSVASPASTVAPTPGPTAPTAFRPGKKMACPTVRSVAVTLADGRVLIAGGCEEYVAGVSTSREAEIFDPRTGMFTLTGSMTSDRSNIKTAAVLKSGRVLFAGGNGIPLVWSAWPELIPGPVTPIGDEIYDPATGRFSPTGPVVKERAGASSVVLDDGRVLIVGGDLDKKNTAEIYDPVTGAFTAAGPIIPGTDGPLVLLQNGLVLVIVTSLDNPRGAELYEPNTNQFTPTGTLTVARDSSMAAAPLSDGKAIVLGGDTAGTVEVYDPATGSFGRVAPMARPMQVMSCTALKDGRILVLGTVIGEPQPQYGSLPESSGNLLFDRRPAASPGRVPSAFTGPFIVTGELYDPATNKWTVLGHLNDQRSDWSVALLQDGRVLIAGGGTDTAELFDPKTGKFTLNR